MGECVYVVRDAERRAKIGRTTNVANRMSSIRSASGSDVELVRQIAGGRRTEAWMHHRFQPNRLKGEWFRWCDTMLTVEPPIFEGDAEDALMRKGSLIAQLMRKCGGAGGAAGRFAVHPKTAARWVRGVSFPSAETMLQEMRASPEFCRLVLEVVGHVPSDNVKKAQKALEEARAALLAIGGEIE